MSVFVLASATMTQPPVLGVTTATTKATVSVQDNAIADIKALIEDEHGNCEVDRAALSAKLEIMATKLDELVAKLDGSLEAIETMEGELAKVQQKLVAIEVSDKKAVAKKPAKAAKKAK